MVKYLIEKGADIHADNDYAARRSAENGHLEVVKYLIEKGASISISLEEQKAKLIKNLELMEKISSCIKK